jgi:hypothetical protein
MNDSITSVVHAALIPSNRCGLKNTDCSLDASLRREVNLVVARTLMQLRHESLLEREATEDTTTQGQEPIVLGKKLGKVAFQASMK